MTTIIFDWDNTLFDFQYYWEQAHQQIFKEYDFDKYSSYDDFMKMYRTFDKHLWQQLLNNDITLDELRTQRIILTLKHYQINFNEQQAQVFFQRFFEILLEKIEPNTQRIKQIQLLQQKYPLAILTNGKIEEQVSKIKRAKFEGLLPVYISEEIGFEKPDFKAFEFVLKDLNVAAHTTIMVGDSLENDIRPAKQLGMTTVYISDTQNEVADYTFDNIDEAIDFLLNR